MKLFLATLLLALAIPASALAYVSGGDSGAGLPTCNVWIAGLRAVNANGQPVYCGLGSDFQYHWTYL